MLIRESWKFFTVDFDGDLDFVDKMPKRIPGFVIGSFVWAPENNAQTCTLESEIVDIEFPDNFDRNKNYFARHTNGLDWCMKTYIPDLKLDQKLNVVTDDGNIHQRHFSHFCGEMVHCFKNGRTSFTNNNRETAGWYMYVV